jgi:hypothetical protein
VFCRTTSHPPDLIGRVQPVSGGTLPFYFLSGFLFKYDQSVR